MPSAKVYSATVHLLLLNIYAAWATPNVGDLRLIHRNSSNGNVTEGRLEIYTLVNTTWKPFCFTSFGGFEADLACKQLGFSNASHYAEVSTLGFDQSSGGDSFTVSCRHYERNLSTCYMGTTSDCSHNSDVGLKCSRQTLPVRGELRLVNDLITSNFSGRLELYYHHSSSGYSWTPFCSTDFNEGVSNSACKRLGFYSSKTFGSVIDFGFSPGSGNVSITSVNCPSYFQDRSSCSYSKTTSCSHNKDVGLFCTAYDDGQFYGSGYQGLPQSVSITVFILLLFFCFGTMLIAGVVTFLCHRKRVQSHNLASLQFESQPASGGATRMSDLSAMNLVSRTASVQPLSPPQYTPSPYATVNLEHYADDLHDSDETEVVVRNAATEGDDQEDIMDAKASSDNEPLLA